jgi:hypothetical protein
MNDVVWQSTPIGPVTATSGTYSGQQVMRIKCDQALANGLTPTDGEVGYVHVPGWTNPNTGATEFISGAAPIQDSLGAIQNNLLTKASSIQAKVVASLAPIEELTSAIGLAVSSGNLPAALDGALSGAVKTAMAAAKADVAANPHVDPTPPAGAPPDEGGGGRPK